MEGARELLDEDEEFAELSRPPSARIEELEEEIRLAMVERDPNDDKNVIVEIRAGTGGDEAGLFAGDLYRMLTRYAERLGFKTETLERRRGRPLHVRDQGRRRLLHLQVRGRHAPRAARAGDRVAGPHPHLHRDRRRAARGRGGRRADRPERPADRRLPLLRPRRPVGQHDRLAVRITHKPTGIVVSMQDEKSQLQNREKAMRVLRARLFERALAEQQAAEAAERKAQVGTGERSEKIRTYNFPQGRVTDHRIKLTAHNLDAVLDGDLAEFTAALQADEKRAEARGAGRRGLSGARCA